MTSTLGQLFIYFTMDNFGPVIFSMIMASRQLFSLVASAAIFGHSLPPTSLVGAVVVFLVRPAREVALPSY